MEYGWLLEAITLSLENSTSTTTTSAPPHHSPPPQGDSPRQRLIDGIVYSRKFILTYHACVLVSIAIFSALHWGSIIVRRGRRRESKWQTSANEQVIDDRKSNLKHADIARWKDGNTTAIVTEVFSSGSSTSEASASSPQEDVPMDERSLLLPRARILTSTDWSWISPIQALLIYQPRPVPYVNKLLPSNGASATISAFIFLNMFYCSYNMEFSLPNIFVLADRWGLMFVANLPLLYLLAAKNQPLKLMTGRSYESLNILHRRLGELLCLQALLHALSMTVTWYFFIRPSGRLNFTEYLSLPVIYFGLGAFSGYELLYLTSLGSFRQRFYELFLASHVLLQSLALIFLYFHHPVNRVYIGAALAIFLADRIVFRLIIRPTNVIASARILEDGETVKLSANVVLESSRASIKSGWRPTDHVFVTATALGKNHILMAHPFTIASTAPETSAKEVTLELLVRAQTGFSRDLLNYVHRHNTLSVRLDGPYGSPHARHLLEESNLAIIVAGGSGIAVAWPLVSHLSSNSDAESCRYLRPRKVVLIWVIHQDTHTSWLSSSSIEQARLRGVEIVIPKPTEEAGRPDLKSMVEDIVGEYDGVDVRGRIGVVVSGPDGMNRTVRNTCAKLVWEGRDVGVCVEKFGW